jgi:hypothetical protein
VYNQTSTLALPAICQPLQSPAAGGLAEIGPEIFHGPLLYKLISVGQFVHHTERKLTIQDEDTA